MEVNMFDKKCFNALARKCAFKYSYNNFPPDYYHYYRAQMFIPLWGTIYDRLQRTLELYNYKHNTHVIRGGGIMSLSDMATDSGRCLRLTVNLGTGKRGRDIDYDILSVHHISNTSKGVYVVNNYINAVTDKKAMLVGSVYMKSKLCEEGEYCIPVKCQLDSIMVPLKSAVRRLFMNMNNYNTFQYRYTGKVSMLKETMNAFPEVKHFFDNNGMRILSDRLELLKGVERDKLFIKICKEADIMLSDLNEFEQKYSYRGDYSNEDLQYINY